MRGFKAGNTRTPVFGIRLAALFEHAWLIASLDLRDARIRSAHLLLAVLTEPGLAQVAHRVSGSFARFDPDPLKHRLDEWTHGSREARQPAPDGRSGRTGGDAVGDHAVPDEGRTPPSIGSPSTSRSKPATEGSIR